MDQNGGGGPNMGNTYDLSGLGPDELQQMHMDSDMMNIDMSGMQNTAMAMGAGFGDMMDTSDHDQRRQSQQNFAGNRMSQGAEMANFVGGPPSDLDGFQFDPSPMPPSASMGAGLSPAAFAQSPAGSTGTPNSMSKVPTILRRRKEREEAQKAQRRASAGNLGLDTSYESLNSGMTSMGQSPIYPMTASGVPMSMDNPYYSNTAMSAIPLRMDFNLNQGGNMQNPMGLGMYQNQGMPQHQAINSTQNVNSGQNMNQNQNQNQAMMQNINQAINQNIPQQTHGSAPSSSRRQSFPPVQQQQQQQLSMPALLHRQSSGVQSSGNQTPKAQPGQIQNGGIGHSEGRDDIQKLADMSVADPYNHSQLMNQMQAVIAGRTAQGMGMGMDPNRGGFAHGQPPLHDNNNFVGYDGNNSQNVNNFTTGHTNNIGMSEDNPGQIIPQYLNAYSSTGFDMLNVLMRVATRPKPRINIGAVDMSCAFVVCDVSQHDLPIVYCSEMFERLTGYNRHEILGRNCRFLQAPDGRVESGIKRKYVDDRAVLHLKNMINQRQEAQISLINYRKGGQPFMNLLTMIPIAWESDEIRYYVGFQVDLVEQPTSITNKNPDGTYQINYQRGWLPRYVFNPSENGRGKDPELDRSIPKDEVTTVLSTINTDSELSKRIWDKVLLENTDDVVHVLSLKGLFLYLSPACKAVLEYESHELVGTALSSVCHPSDIVPVTRELKDTSTGAAVSVIFRIRRKFSGYTWFEAHGALHNEQGKSKKCIILVGRARPVYALLRNDIVNGFGESELWTKMSTTGMFLYVSQHVKSLLDRVPDEMIGTSAQSLMRSESKAEFGKALEFARTGYKHTFKHDVQNKRGQTLHAETTLYPGDSTEGTKPTFIIGQTRLLKMGRGQPALLKQNSGQSDRSSTFMNPIGSASPSTHNTGPSGPQSGNDPTPERAANGQGTPTNNLQQPQSAANGILTSAGGHSCPLGNQDELLAADDNVFDELKTTRSTSWQFELRQMEKRNRLLAEELQSLLSSRKKRKRRKGIGQMQKDCANCHTRNTPEWRRGPSGQRDLCNSCGLRWAKQQGRVSPRTSSQHSGDKHSQASSPRISHGDRMTNAASQGSPADQKSPALGQSNRGTEGGKDIKVEMPGSITGASPAGPAATGQRTVPQTIQEGVEPADEEL